MRAPKAGDGPSIVVEHAAEAVRTLNHLTLVPPCPSTPGWEDVADLYQVLTEVRVLAERLPQVIGQLARHLEGPGGEGYRCDAGTTETPEAVVAEAVAALDAAAVAMRGVGCDLACAQEAVAHLAPRCEAG